MKKEFNIGDRVRFTKDYDIECVCVDKGDCGTIERIDANGIMITLDNPECVRIFDTDYIVPITPIDPKTAFFTRLQSILREFDAKIEYHIGSDDKSDYTEYYAITIGRERLTYDNCDGASLTADNIMDYDKE